MEITKIEVQKNNKEKVNIFVDNKYNFSLSINNLSKFNIYNGRVLTEEEIEHYKNEDTAELAYLFLLDKISYKMYTEKELRDKLKKKEFDENSIELSIEKAKSFNLINDAYYCKCYIEQRGIPNKWGSKVIFQKLMQVGIDKEIIKESLDEFFSNDEESDNCYELALKKAKMINLTDFSDRKLVDKLYRFLMSKGYNFDDINNAIEKIKRNNLI